MIKRSRITFFGGHCTDLFDLLYLIPITHSAQYYDLHFTNGETNVIDVKAKL